MYLGKTGAVPKNSEKARARGDVDRRADGLKESQIQEQCEDLLDHLRLAYIRIPDSVYRWVFGSGSRIPVAIRRLISAFIRGLPDITILLRDGRYICVELKTVTGKLSQGQKRFSKMVGEQNYHVVRSVQGLKELLQEYGVIKK